MKSVKQVLGNNLQQYTMIAAMILLAVFFQWKSGGNMLTSSNLQNLITGNAYVISLAIGMLMVIVIGQIDLSVGSVSGFIGMFVCIVATNHGVNWILAVLMGLVFGLLIGAWHGFWLSKVGIPGFITTLAGMMIFRGLAIWISGSISVVAPDGLSWFGSGYLPEWGPGFTGMNNSTLLLGLIAICFFVWSEFRRRAALVKRNIEAPMWATVARCALIVLVIGYLTWIFGSGRPGTSFPVPGLIILALVIIYHIVTERTAFGRHIYAVGGNRAAAALSGVNTARTYFLVMLNMSFLAALTGIMYLGRSTAAGPNDGNGWELDAIAAVFIGGAAVSGGIGTVVGTVVGALVMGVLNSGLALLGIGQEKVSVIKGLVLLAAVAFDVYSKQQGRPSIIGRLTRGRAAASEQPAPTHTNQTGPDETLGSVPVEGGPAVTAADAVPTDTQTP